MRKHVVNLFIVDDDKLTATLLKHLLESKLRDHINITTFEDGESCLKKIDSDTHIIILDYFMKAINGLEVLKAIKVINPKAEVIMLTSNEDDIIAIEALRAGAKDYLAKGVGSQKKVIRLVNTIVANRLKLALKKNSRANYAIGCLIALAVIGIIVFFAMRTHK